MYVATPYTMAGAQTLARRVTGKKTNKPYGNADYDACHPTIWQFEISGGILAFRTNSLQFAFMEGHGRWNVALDRPYCHPHQRQYMGRSIAHWDGNTLVVETSSFQTGRVAGYRRHPAVEEWQADHAHSQGQQQRSSTYLEMIHTIVDPVNTHEWSMVRILGWQPNRAKLAGQLRGAGGFERITDNGFLIDTDISVAPMRAPGTRLPAQCGWYDGSTPHGSAAMHHFNAACRTLHNFALLALLAIATTAHAQSVCYRAWSAACSQAPFSGSSKLMRRLRISR
jgi:hypothetical protein